MKNLVLLVLAIFTAVTMCISGEIGTMTKERTEMLNHDKAFSDTCKEKGYLTASAEFMATDGILLPVKGHPLYGIDACKKLAKNSPATLKDRTWEQLESAVSKSNDLGFTIGRYTPVGKTKKGLKDNDYIYFQTIWKKESGQWKIALSQGLMQPLVPYLPAPGNERKIDETDLNEATKTVLATERAFSAYAQTHGIAAAFYRYIDKYGIVLHRKGVPSWKGTYADAVKKEKNLSPEEKEKPKPKLKWEPYYSLTSKSGDLAFNYGPYTLTVKGPDGKTQHKRGYFVTVWQKQTDGTWKFRVDGGNFF